jgi:hypothetical protein
MLPGRTEEEQRHLLLSVGTRKGERALTPCETSVESGYLGHRCFQMMSRRDIISVTDALERTAYRHQDSDSDQKRASKAYSKNA